MNTSIAENIIKDLSDSLFFELVSTKTEKITSKIIHNSFVHLEGSQCRFEQWKVLVI